jgi:hypothetical protein
MSIQRRIKAIEETVEKAIEKRKARQDARIRRLLDEDPRLREVLRYVLDKAKECAVNKNDYGRTCAPATIPRRVKPSSIGIVPLPGRRRPM